MKCLFRTISVFCIGILLLSAGVAVADDLTIGNYQLISKQRVGRTYYNYTYKADVTNSGPDVKNVMASVTSNSSHTTVVDGMLSFGDVASGSSVTSNDTFTIKQNRRYPLDWSDLVWDIHHGDAAGVIGPEGGVVEVTDVSSPIYGAKVEIPPEALNSEIVLTIAEKIIAPELPQETLSAGAVLDIGPDGTVFETPVNITMQYDDADDDGILDGTDISENNVCGLTYDNELMRWLYLKKISQDTINNTLTFAADHLTDFTVGGLDSAYLGGDVATFFTIDGLDFDKLDWGFFDYRSRIAYLKPAIMLGMKNLGLRSSDIYSYGGGPGESWSGDANYTQWEVLILIKVLNSEFNKANSANKKFILITHSWGTVLGYLALQYCDVEPDLFMTLSSPLGTAHVPGDWPLKVAISTYLAIERAQTEILMRLLWRSPHDPIMLDNPDKNWINYWAMGDLISGPLSDRYDEIMDKTVDQQSDRDSSSTTIYHAITSLDARGVDDEYLMGETGSWAEYLNQEHLDLARCFRNRVEADIKAVIDDCHKLDPNCDGCIDSEELAIAIEMWKNGEITILELMDAITIWKACSNKTQFDDFSTDTTGNYDFVYYISPDPPGSVGATIRIDYDAVNKRAILYANGGYGWSLMTPKDATPIPTTWDFEFSVDFEVLNEYVATLYLGDSSSSGPGIAFILDTYADYIYVRQLMPDGTWIWPSPEPGMPYSGNSVTLSVSRHGGLYEFAVNGEPFWSSTLDFLDVVYYGAQHWITSGPSGWTARVAVDNWEFHAAPFVGDK